MSGRAAPDVGRSAAERFARFSQKPSVMDATNRYADWAGTPDGIIVTVQLSGLAMARFSGRLSWRCHQRAVRDLAKESGLPPQDFPVLAQYVLELVSHALVGSGQIPPTADR
jgi:hypothetical protein